MTAADADLGSATESQEQDKVSSAFYPISQPLVAILRLALNDEESTNDVNTNDGIDSPILSKQHSIERAPLEKALEQLLRNAFVAMDSMFFSTPGWQRKRPSFQHRTCIRISTDTERKTLTITDLGSGMTRSDLINSLGAGGRLSRRALLAARMLGSEKAIVEDDDSYSDDTDSDDDDTTSTCSNEDNGIHLDGDETMKEQKLSCPCSVDDIGGFYSALCALAVGVEIGTKVRL
jgi:hypothetical protein